MIGTPNKPEQTDTEMGEQTGRWMHRQTDGITISHIRSSDPYVSSLSEKSVPHRYPCEISVTNTR